jgi:hypothetical protein
MTVTPSLDVFRIDRTRQSNWPDALHRVRLLTVVHVLSSFNVERQISTADSALQRSNATGRASNTDRTHRSRTASAPAKHRPDVLQNWPDALHLASGLSPVRVHSRPDASGRLWPYAHRVRLTLWSVVPLGAWPDAPVPRSTGRAGRTDRTCAARCSATDRTRPVIPRPRPVQRPVTSVTSVHLRFYPRCLRENLRHRCSGKYVFYFHKKRRIPPHKLGRRERGTQNPLYRSNFTSFTNVPTRTSDHHLVYVC